MLEGKNSKLIRNTEFQGKLIKGWNDKKSSVSDERRIVIVPFQVEHPICPSRTSKPENDKLIRGVRELAKFLGCGVNKAQQVMNSGVLTSEKIAYRVGRNWIMKRADLSALLEKNPTILEKLSTK